MRVEEAVISGVHVYGIHRPANTGEQEFRQKYTVIVYPIDPLTATKSFEKDQ